MDELLRRKTVEALAPFARIASQFNGSPDHAVVMDLFKVEDLRRASTVLEMLLAPRQ